MTDLDDRAYLETFAQEPVYSDPRIDRIKRLKARGFTSEQINLLFKREKEAAEKRLAERRSRRKVVRRG